MELLRAIDDDIYCMVFEKHSKNYYLHRLRFFANENESGYLQHFFQPIQIATVGEIIACELDPI